MPYNRFDYADSLHTESEVKYRAFCFLVSFSIGHRSMLYRLDPHTFRIQQRNMCKVMFSLRYIEELKTFIFHFWVVIIQKKKDPAVDVCYCALAYIRQTKRKILIFYHQINPHSFRLDIWNHSVYVKSKLFGFFSIRFLCVYMR